MQTKWRVGTSGSVCSRNGGRHTDATKWLAAFYATPLGKLRRAGTSHLHLDRHSLLVILKYLEISRFSSSKNFFYTNTEHSTTLTLHLPPGHPSPPPPTPTSLTTCLIPTRPRSTTKRTVPTPRWWLPPVKLTSVTCCNNWEK